MNMSTVWVVMANTCSPCGSFVGSHREGEPHESPGAARDERDRLNNARKGVFGLSFEVRTALNWNGKLYISEESVK